MPQNDPQKEVHSKKNHFFPALVLLILVLGSALGLDYIQWQRGDPSFLFSQILKDSSTNAGESFPDLVIRILSVHGLDIEPATSTGYGENRTVFPHPVSQETYSQVAPLFLSDFQKARISVNIDHTLEETSESFLWELKDQGGQGVYLLFNCPLEPEVDSVDIPVVKPKNRVAIIIDDMGNNVKTVRELGAIGQPLTVAVLPFSSWPEETAQAARQFDLEVILHLPLESLNDHEMNSTTRGLIHSEMSEEEALQTLEKNLAQVPFILGVNNHMGSKMTSKREWMRPILERLKKENLYFIDSVTNGRSIAYKMAQEMGIPSAFRHVFLDAETEADYILKQFKQLLRLAQRQGTAVGICHPQETTLRVLAESIYLLEEYNCEAVYASQVVK
jgi:polysaccharide deacetylase 2 family uncharacterized protein YibQ